MRGGEGPFHSSSSGSRITAILGAGRAGGDVAALLSLPATPPFCQSPGPATASPTLLRAPQAICIHTCVCARTHTHTHVCMWGRGPPPILRGGCAWSTIVCGSGSQREPRPSVSPNSGVNDSAPNWQAAWSLNKVIVDACCGLPPDGLPVCRHPPGPSRTHTKWSCRQSLPRPVTRSAACCGRVSGGCVRGEGGWGPSWGWVPALATSPSGCRPGRGKVPFLPGPISGK